MWDIICKQHKGRMCKLCLKHRFRRKCLETLLSYSLLNTSKKTILSNERRVLLSRGAVGCFPEAAKLASHKQDLSSTIDFEGVLFEVNHEGHSMSNSRKIDTGVITDVCNRADLPEVEILSLLEEQIPKYKLRADTITDFRGYDNEDWILTPLIPLDDDLELTTEQIAETLKYFILCAERVTQMTRTYNDIEAVTRLLEEKERDLELAARIGQNLLEKNKELSDKNENLEEELSTLNDKVNQLKHEVSMKDELLRFYTQDLENAESESSGSTPSEKSNFSLDMVNIGALKNKVKLLEDDNLELRLETTQLKTATDTYEEKEEKLVHDCLKQLVDVNKQLELFSEELAKKSEEGMHQKEEITRLLSQVVDLQKKNREVSFQNVEIQRQLEAAQDSQKKLTQELGEMHDRYDELLELYDELQDELRALRRMHKPIVARKYLSTSSLMPSDSLASELESSLRGKIDYPTGYSPAERKAHNWKIFETARAAKKASLKSLGRRNLRPRSLLNQSITGADSGDSTSVSLRSSLYLSDAESAASDGYSADLDSLYSSTSNLGRPGIPGSNDLETALRRLMIKRANDSHDKDFKEEEEEQQHNTLCSEQRMETDEGSTSNFCRTPESWLSTGSGLSGHSGLSATGNVGLHFKIPEKLQIIKPMEGSVTLRHWQQLAKPHLGRLFESCPGVQIKGERKLDLEEEVYMLSDFEEDDDYQQCPSKKFPESSPVYTLTNSTVMHPSDMYKQQLDEPLTTGSPGTLPFSVRCTKPSKPAASSTSTFSMSLGLASILNERGLGSSGEDKVGLKINHRSARFPCLSSETVLNNTKSSTPAIYTNSSNSSTTCSHESGMLTTGSEGASFFEKLKNKGFSIYGILSSNSRYANTEDPAVSAQTSATSTTAGDSLLTESAVNNNVPASNDVKQSQKHGMLDALTSFRQSGML